MSLKLGNDDVAKVMLGSQEVSAIYKGADEVWAAGGSGKPIENISEAFSTYLYKGNKSTNPIANGVDLDGEGGLVWIKNRENSKSHALFDTERGPHNQLYSNTNSQAYDTPGLGVSSFNSDGFTLVGAGTETNSPNDYASWTFRKAPSFFDIVIYEGTGAIQEIPHNLGCVPGMIIIKNVDSTATWIVYSNGAGPNGALKLDTNGSFETSSGYFNNTAPTDSVFTLGTAGNSNQAGDKFVAYLFAHDDSDESMIKCGSYTGNGNVDGPEIDLGFEPQWVLIKGATGGSSSWILIDSIRGVGSDQGDPRLEADNSNAEDSRKVLAGFTSTGFKINGKYSGVNRDANSDYTYMAIKADPNFRMPPEWEQMNQEVAEKIARRDAAREAITEKVKDSKDIKDDG